MHARSLRDVAQRARTHGAGRFDEGRGLRDLPARRLDEREHHERRRRQHTVSQSLERHRAHAQVATRQEREQHRAEIALDAEHLRAGRQVGGEQAHHDARLSADRDASRVDADDAGVVDARRLDMAVVPLRIAIGGEPPVEIVRDRVDGLPGGQAHRRDGEVPARVAEALAGVIQTGGHADSIHPRGA